MKNILLAIILLLTATAVSGQESCKFRGVVLDSIALPVFDASVTAFDANNQSAGYTFTNEDGEFSLDLACGKDYELEIEHISYESLIYKIKMDKSKKEKIILKRNAVELEAAVIEARIPIKVKGDTIEYDAESFKNGSEENLEDILKKLPGIEVENGKVYYQGEEITTITVEGREIFGGNTKLLNKNLPSDVVDKIQLNKKFKNNPFTSSLQDDEQPSLNITLKEDKKNLIFGNITLGGDADEHSDLQEKLFYFSPKSDATVIADFNTYGKEVFDREDYFAFLGGASEFLEEGSSFSLRNPTSGINLGATDQAANLNNFIGAVHYGYEPNDKWYANAFALFNKNNQEYRTTTNRIYDFGNALDQQETEENLLSGLLRARVDYNPSSNGQFRYRLNANYVDNEQIDDVSTTGSLIDDESFRTILSDNRTISLRQKFSYLRSIGEDDNLGIYVRHQYQGERPDWLVNSTENPFTIFDTQEQNNVFNLNQEQNFNNQIFQVYGIYNHLLSNTSNLKVKLGSNFVMQDYENQIFTFDTLLDGANAASGEQQEIDSDFNYSETYLDLTYTKKWGKLKMDIGSAVNYFLLENQGIATNGKIDIVRALPHASFRYEFNSSKSIRFNYDRSYNLPNTRDLTQAYRLQSYFSIDRGNESLDRGLNDNWSLGYYLFDAFNFFNFFANVNYNQQYNAYLNATNVIANPDGSPGVTQINSRINSPETNKTWSGNLRISKRFSSKYGISFRANGSYSDRFSFLNDGLINNINITQSYRLNNRFKFKKKIEVNAGLRLNLSDFRQRLRNEFTTWEPYADMAWIVSKDVLLQGEYQYQLQNQNGELLNEVHALSASVRWKPAKKVYLKLTGGNLLDNDQIVNSSFNDNFTQITSRDVLGRFLIFSVRYKF